MRYAVIVVTTALLACSGEDGGNTNQGANPPPAPVDGVGVFNNGSMSYRFAPENTGYVGGGRIISDGSGLALGGWRSNSQGMVLEYRFSRGGTSTSGNLYLRRYLSSQRCSGTDTGTLTDNDSFTLANFILTNDGTGQECRGGANGNYSPSLSEFPATSISDFAGTFSSTTGPANDAGGFDVGGNRFFVRIEASGSFLLNGQCSGAISLIETGKGIARISNVAPTSCGNTSGAAIEGLAAFDGSNLIIFLVQPGTYHFWHGTLQRE